MTALAVHKCRVFDYMPKPVHCMAAKACQNNLEHQLLAVGREGGNIDIYNTLTMEWNIIKTIHGRDDRSIECLIWGSKCGLVSGSLQGFITAYGKEVLKNNKKPLEVDSFGGAVWALSLNDITEKIAAACEDGSVKIFDGNSPTLDFIKSLDKQEGRIISVDWHSSGDIIVTGSTSAARVWSYRSGHAIQKISVGSEETIVWSVAFLEDRTVVTADSNGTLQFWNSKHGTQLACHESHRADILCLQTTNDGKKIYASGVDTRVMEFDFVENEEGGRWVMGGVALHQSHDVRSLAVVGDFLAAGGVDPCLMYRSIRDEKDHRIRKVLSFPHRKIASYSEESRLLTTQFHNYVDIWVLPTTTGKVAKGSTIKISNRPIKLLQMRPPSSEPFNMICSCISRCGGWFAYSTSAKLRLYKLMKKNDNNENPEVERVHFVGLQPSNALEFTQDSKFLISASLDGSICLIALEQDGVHVAHTFQTTDVSNHLLACASSGTYIAVADLQCAVSVYDITKQQFHCRLPKFGCVATAIAFKPGSHDLVIVTEDHKVYEYDVDNRSYTDWSKRKNLKLNVRKKHNTALPPCVHISFINPVKILFADSRNLLVVNQGAKSHEKTTSCHSIQGIIYMSKMSDDELLLVERSLADIQAGLPPTLYQKKFLG